MALKNSTDRGALERLLLSRLPRKEISALVQSYTQPYRELMSYYRCAMMEVETTRSFRSSMTATPSRASKRASSPPRALPKSSSAAASR